MRLSRNWAVFSAVLVLGLAGAGINYGAGTSKAEDDSPLRLVLNVPANRIYVYEHGKRDSVEIEYLHDLPTAHLPPGLDDAVFRIIQESLQNACRHSRSDKIRVSLEQSEGWINIEVRDWGIGFDLNSVEGKRFGLQGIRERARLLDGQVAIESAPNEGTRISVAIPIKNSAT